MLGELRKIFGLKEDDEVVAILVVLAILLLVGFFILRGCAPNDLAGVAIDSAEIATDITPPSAETPLVRNRFNGGKAEFAGMGEPNSEIDLYINGKQIGTTRTDATGAWSFDYIAPRETGEYELDLVQHKDGVTLKSAQQYAYAIGAAGLVAAALDDDEATARPTDEPRATTASNAVAAVAPTAEPTAMPEPTTAPEPTDVPPTAVPTATDVPPTATPEPTAVPPTAVPTEAPQVLIPPTLKLPDGDVSAEGFTLTGEGTPGAIVEIFRNGESIGTTTIDAGGLYSFDTSGVAYKTDFRVFEFTTDGAEIGKTSTKRLVFPSLIAAVGLDSVGLNDDNSVNLSGTGEPGFAVDVFANGENIGSATVGSDGTWSLSDPYAASFGTTTFSATQLLSAEEAHSQADDQLVDIQLPDTSIAAVWAASDGADESSPVVELILDASWSMVKDDTGGERRIDIARAVLLDLLADPTIIPDGTPVALRTFGNIEGDYSCRTDLMAPLAPLNREELSAIIAEVEPQENANTAIARSLVLSASDLVAGQSRPKIVVLLTDGEETCGGNPASAIQALNEQRIDLKVNIVGLAIDSDDLRQQFQDLAAQGGGEYFDASDKDELAAALADAVSVPYRVLDAEGNVVARGIVDRDPVVVEPGTYTVEILTNPVRIIEEVVIDAEPVTVVAP